jgi:surface polysaccharide O-acyltransferase-like enzyme
MNGRLFFLDWLRIAAFGLLVLYHVGMYYVSWDWHVKSPFASTALEPLMLLSAPWRLALLFLISGAASALMLGKEPAGFLRQRSWRLLLPLLAGMFVIVPPQAYVEVVHKLHYSGSYIDFMGLYLQGYHGFCRDGNCLALPTWNHLWFVAYLWVYTLLLWLLQRLAPRALEAAGAWLQRSLTPTVLLALPVVVLALARVTLLDAFPSTHDLVKDFYNHVLFGSVFLAGAVFARAPGVWVRLAALRWAVLPVAVVGWVLLVLYFSHYSSGSAPPQALRQTQRVLYAAVQWCAIVAALGFACRHWDRDHPWRNYLVDAVFPVYILHQTLIILLSRALLPLGWRPWAEGPVLVLATFALSLAGYELVRRVGILRPWFGLKARSPRIRV